MKRQVSLFLLFLLIIGVVYSPVLYFDYIFHDDASFWVKLKEYGFTHIFFDTCMSQCRFGDALLLSLENFFVHKVSDLRSLRFLGIVVSSCTACLLFQQMRRLSFPDIQAFLIIAAMFFLPGFTDFLFYGISSSYFPLCIFISCWSFQRVEASKGMAAAVLALLFAITIYPPAAMFYWTMTGMYILFTRDRFSIAFRNDLLRLMAAGLLSLLIYAILVFLTHYFYPQEIGNNLYNPYIVAPDYLGKLKWFLQEPLGNALNLWDIFPKVATSVIILTFVAITALVVMARKGFSLTSLWQLCLFIVVFFLTFLPNLAAQGNAAFYRCLVPLTSLIWLVVVWAILQWMEIMPMAANRWGAVALLSIIAACAGTKTNQNVLYYRVLPSHVEWEAYRSMAAQIRSKKIDAIHILLPYHFGLERYDEFGVLTSNYTFDIYHLIYCAFNETGGPVTSLPLVYVSYPNDDTLFQMEEIYFKKLPDKKWVFRVVNREEQYHEYDHSGKNTLDHGMTTLLIPQKIPAERQNWYILNLNDIFSPSNYNILIKKEFNDHMVVDISAESYNDLGNLYYKKEDFTHAIADFEKAADLKPDYEMAYYNLGLTYYKQGNLPQAISEYDKALAINPKDTGAYNDQAVIYYHLKEYDKAWDDVQKMENLGAAVNPKLISVLDQVSPRGLRPLSPILTDRRSGGRALGPEGAT